MKEDVVHEMQSMKLAGHTYAQIAVKYGITRQRVQQLIAPPKAIRDHVIAKYGGRCAACGILIEHRGDIHHAGSDVDTYNDIESLRLLCIPCHMKIHVRPKDLKAPRIKLPTTSGPRGELACETCKTFFVEVPSSERKPKRKKGRKIQHWFCSNECLQKWIDEWLAAWYLGLHIKGDKTEHILSVAPMKVRTSIKKEAPPSA